MQQNPPDYDEVRAILSDICHDDRLAAAVIDRMRSMLKKRDLELESLPLKYLLNQVVFLTRAEMRARRVMMQVDLPAGLPPVRGDCVHLQQVLLNLLVNGADAMSDLPAIQRRLLVQARQLDDRTVEMAVHDAGHGIPPEKLPTIFEPFFTTKSGGMGMGLTISRTIVESHGGRISAENNAEGGATFRFTLAVSEAGGGK